MCFSYFIQKWKKNNERSQASKPLHTSLCKAVPAPQPPVLLHLYPAHPPCCSVASQLCCVGPTLTTQQMFPFQCVSSGGERLLARQSTEGDKWCHLWQPFHPSSLWALASQDSSESCAYGIRQPIHYPFFCPEHGLAEAQEANCCWCRHWDCCEQEGLWISLHMPKQITKSLLIQTSQHFFCPFIPYLVGSSSGQAFSGI